MTLRASPVRRPPRWVTVCWALSVPVGLAAVVPLPARGAEGLTPQTLPAFLARVPPRTATALRVNGLYGSGHAGAWEVVAHVTWEKGGTLHGGVVHLPALAGAPPEDLGLGEERLRAEQRTGWTLAELALALRGVLADPPLAYVELAIPPGAAGSLVACAAPATGTGRCLRTDRSGRHGAAYAEPLVDTPGQGALSVSGQGRIGP